MRFFIIAFLFFFGCSHKEAIFVDIEARQIKKCSSFIGLQEVVMPSYYDGYLPLLKKGKIVFKKPLAFEPTKRALEILKRKYCIKLYPWDFDREPKHLLKIIVKKFYIKNSKAVVAFEVWFDDKRHFFEKRAPAQGGEGLLKLYDELLMLI